MNTRILSAEQPLAATESLATRISDVMAGYGTMMEKADPDLKPVIERLYDLHAGHYNTLMSLIAQLGGEPEQAGSMMGNVHKAIATLRDWTGSLDKSAIDEIANGERRVVDMYSDAISSLTDEPEYRSELEQQREVLRGAIADLER